MTPNSYSYGYQANIHAVNNNILPKQNNTWDILIPRLRHTQLVRN